MTTDVNSSNSSNDNKWPIKNVIIKITMIIIITICNKTINICITQLSCRSSQVERANCMLMTLQIYLQPIETAFVPIAELEPPKKRKSCMDAASKEVLVASNELNKSDR